MSTLTVGAPTHMFEPLLDSHTASEDAYSDSGGSPPSSQAGHLLNVGETANLLGVSE